MAILITGAAGYIGSVCAHYLIEAEERVVALDNLATGHREAIHPEAAFFEGSILDRPLLDRIFREHKIDTVMHFAAFSLVGESCENPRKYFENNVEGAHTVLKAMVDAGAPRFILSSTAAVYGNPDHIPITEDMPARPLNPYGLSKRMIEQMLEWYGQAYGLRSVCLRYFNAAGASKRHGEDHNPETHLIPNVIKAAMGQQADIKVFGRDYPTKDGTCIRDYIHVEDLAEAHYLAARYLREGGASDVFNLGAQEGNSVLEVIETVKAVSGVDFPVNFTERRAGDADVLIASSEKARNILGWTPGKSDIQTIVADAWAWFQAHPRGYAA